MKTTVSTIAAIAVAFSGLAFMPAQKNNAMDEAVISTDMDAEKAGRCKTKFEKDVSFEKCNDDWTETSDSEQDEQADILDKY